MDIRLTSREILWTRGKNDECYTPHYGVTPILKYIPEGKIVWCPFDKEDSEFVKQIREPVVYSHIDTGQDFFEGTQVFELKLDRPLMLTVLRYL